MGPVEKCIREACDIIANGDWGQGPDVNGECNCMGTSTLTAREGWPESKQRVKDEYVDNVADKLIAEVIRGEPIGEGADYLRVIFDYNDAQGRTIHEVIATMEKAAELAKERGI